ncbi:MAG: nitroreductase family deazaflavin-dependent oxidoreductase [Anaerolineales bacterium]|uniref:nitroreductase/quinone reductase family protein n=1 Tax=Candidatus Villigracilis vicinus TaxID=3140679 RepID=UPI003136CB3A|nr:nitroreductase family deazaflavin-dependent oxidoreductase [Anaerolineales bacterium]
MNGNDFMAWILRSPFHSILSNGMMLITITGRKTGKAYTTPVGYYVEGEYLWVITSRERKWWRNLQGGATVDLLLKRKPVRGAADVELDEKAVEARMYEYLRHVPQAAKPMKVRVENGKPDPQDIANTAKDRLFVKIKLAQ